jgi:hypothetical protein
MFKICHKIASMSFSLEAYYGDYEGIDTVTLCIGTVSFVVPKHDLMRASPVFQRMFASEMTEKALGKVVIEDTNPEEFGDFLKAISPKQEHPARELFSNEIHIGTTMESDCINDIKKC